MLLIASLRSVGWVKLAVGAGGSSQTNRLCQDRLFLAPKPIGERRPTSGPVCSTHPTSCEKCGLVFFDTLGGELLVGQRSDGVVDVKLGFVDGYRGQLLIEFDLDVLYAWLLLKHCFH